MQAIVRAWLPAVAVLVLGWLCGLLAEPHHVTPANASPELFSAVRAQRVLAAVLASQQPHPVGSAQDAAVQAHIVAQFRALGVTVHSYRAFVCNTWRGFAYIPCATVNDLLAEVRPGSGRAVLMMAHADSVPAGPGAADDGAGVACIVEAARALRAAGADAAGTHPVLALISDGEEAGLLGAAAFLQNPALAAAVGAVVNVEARGTRGASLLFQTSPGDARLLQLYAQHVQLSATSSLFAGIYRHLPNDTDLTLFIRAGIPSVNFAIAENVQAYHSPLDSLSMLSPASLQMQGDNLLAMVRALQASPFAQLRSGDALYVTLLGYFLPRMPKAAALPLALVVLLLALWATRRARAFPSMRAAGAPLLMVAGSVLLGQMLWMLAAWISRSSDPGYAHPAALRAALALALWLMLLLASRLGTARQLTAAAWLWIAALGVLAALILPAAVPYFVWPAAVAAVLLLWGAHLPGGWDSRLGRIASTVAALVALLFWLPLATGSMALLGLKLSAAFTLSASLGLVTLLPLMATQLDGPIWRASALVCATAAVLCAVIAALQPSYSASAPERLDLLYLEDEHSAHWIADSAWDGEPPAALPPSLQHAAQFHAQPLALPGLERAAGFVAPAGAPRLSLPQGSIQNDSPPSAGSGQSDLTIRLQGSAKTDEMVLYIPAGTALRGLDIRGQHLLAPAGWSADTTLACVTPDCRDETVTLHLAASGSEAGSLQFVEHDYGLPSFGDFLRAARGPWAMPSQNGDEVLLAGELALPAR
ncbi:MAG TPA: M20/M25/M40 family metallo-hydrolase [Steroidobacteraceae bacterium]